ncbi:MAG: DNA gyrase inhibitor YacG [Sedimentisphaerales bacterium]|nr:DNA gyrase inhibitor YacG [Sedimentisphaerales bacterium]
MNGKRKCPICGAIVVSPSDSSDSIFLKERGRFSPFCSHRCRLVDLNAWLDSDYRIVSSPSRPAEASRLEDPDLP